MRRACLFCTVLLTFLAPRPASAQPVEEDTAIIMWAGASDTSQVASSYVLVGLMTTVAAGPTDMSRITVFVPPHPSGLLCIDFISDDGDVEARAFLPDPRPGPRTILLTGALADSMRRYGPARMAAVAHLSRDCSGSREMVLLSGWGRDAPPHELRVLLNPTDPNAVWLSHERGTNDCPKLNASILIAYSYACMLNASTLAGLAAFNIRIEPHTGPEPLPIPVRVWIPRS